MKPVEGHKEANSRTAISEILDGGSLIEMVYDASLKKSALITWQQGRVTKSPTIRRDGSSDLKPLSPSNNLVAHDVVLFPTAADEFPSVPALAAEIKAFINRYLHVSEQFEEAAVWYVLLTWVYDAFNELPYLRIKGDFGSGKSRALQTIGSICYKPMFASGASTVSPIFRIIDLIRGTLVLDESDFRFSDEKAEIIKILNNGNARGFPVLRSEATPQKDFNPRAFNVYGPKIIATRRDFDDAALESRCITEVMSGGAPRPDIPLSLPPSFTKEAQLLRNKLLLYRFRHVSALRGTIPAKIDGAEPRIAQLLSPLLAVCTNRDARSTLIGLAHHRTAELSAVRALSIEAQILDIISSMQKEGATLVIGEITRRFVERYAGEFDRPISPRWIGTQIRRRLSIAPVKSHGVFVIPRESLSRIEVLFNRFGVDGSAGG
jgi:hypothetical protein